MSNPKCAQCSKTVYVTEKLDCLGKGTLIVIFATLCKVLINLTSPVWHKGCFRCATCNQVLNLKTYQSIAGKPYCKVPRSTPMFCYLARLLISPSSRLTTPTPHTLVSRLVATRLPSTLVLNNRSQLLLFSIPDGFCVL